jgi:transcriptional regulator with XRE-family HTH domain
MTAARSTLHESQGSPRRRSIVAGYVWKLIRESVRLTQTDLADRLGVDVTTVQGWESGRRPIAAINLGDLARHRHRLIACGVSPRMFAVLHDAVEADTVLDHAVLQGEAVGAVRNHPLAVTVHRRELTNLITWPLTGALPSQLKHLVHQATRRGPSPASPILGSPERKRLFGHLLNVAQTCATADDHLLRRQAVYLLAFDNSAQVKEWLASEHRNAMRMARRMNDTPSWVSVRSAAVALAHCGDRDPLTTFVSSGLSSQDQDIANLNYWAYWVGETRDLHTDDEFMRTRDMPWDGELLLEHLVERISPTADQIELYARTISQLLLARPRLLDRRSRLRTMARSRIEKALDGAGLTHDTRATLSNVAFAVRLSEANSTKGLVT